LFAGRFILDHIPVLDKNAVLDAENVRCNPVHGRPKSEKRPCTITKSPFNRILEEGHETEIRQAILDGAQQIAVPALVSTLCTDALRLTQNRFEGGAAPKSDVAQAQTQLEDAQVLASDITVQRAQYEHALAILIGKPPAAFHLAVSPLNLVAPVLPSVPVTLPARLLERRPDIAAAERRMASANEQVGIARAAYYPTLNLAASAGLEGSSILNWFSWPSRFWAVGPELAETLFDAGRRRATTESARAGYDAALAGYRQTALDAFQQVEDNLVVLRVLSTESMQQQQATSAAEESLKLFQNRYAGGVDTYLQVVTSQTTALANERNDIDILRRRLDANVLLIKAMGGGWDVSNLPQL
jgi:NodT family efflux transporter outer membrane factor (OMF) lipoprotein